MEIAVERGRATRQRLLKAAVALVGEVGWNGVTTRLVAKRADVSPGVVHYHYASVTDLLIAACAELTRLTVLHVDKDFELIAEVTGQPVERLAGQVF